MKERELISFFELTCLYNCQTYIKYLDEKLQSGNVKTYLHADIITEARTTPQK